MSDDGSEEVSKPFKFVTGKQSCIFPLLAKMILCLETIANSIAQLVSHPMTKDKAHDCT